jgi:hypothetical protein
MNLIINIHAAIIDRMEIAVADEKSGSGVGVLLRKEI